MTKATIKHQIHEAIDIVQSVDVLKAIHLLLSVEIKHTKDRLSPFTLDEFYERNAQSQKEIKQGKLISHKIVKSKHASK
jgi:hypothetical protein